MNAKILPYADKATRNRLGMALLINLSAKEYIKRTSEVASVF